MRVRARVLLLLLGPALALALLLGVLQVQVQVQLGVWAARTSSIRRPHCSSVGGAAPERTTLPRCVTGGSSGAGQGRGGGGTTHVP